MERHPYLEPEKEYGKEVKRRVSFDLPPLENPTNSFFSHLQNCKYSSFSNKVTTFRTTAHVRFIQELCDTISKKLAQLGGIYLNILPVVVSFLNDEESRFEAWEAHRQSLLDSVQSQLLNDLRDGAKEFQKRGENSMLRRFEIFKGIIKEMMEMIYLAKQGKGKGEVDPKPVASQSASEWTEDDRSSAESPAYSDSWASPDVEVMSNAENPPGNLQSLHLRTGNASHQVSIGHTSQDAEQHRHRVQRHQRELDFLDSLERRYHDVYRLEVKSLLASGVSLALEDWIAQQEHLTQRLEQHFLDRIASISWLTLDAFDTDRLSRLISAVNESIARLEGTGLTLRSQLDRSGIGHHQDSRVHQSAKGQREAPSKKGSSEQSHVPRSQRGTLCSSEKIADYVSNTLNQGFRGGQASRSGSNVSKDLAHMTRMSRALPRSATPSS